jgi:surface antigen
MHRTIPVALLTFALCAPALAVNTSFLKDAPITRLKADELKAYRAFIDKTLSDGSDGVTAEWSAPKTTFKGTVTPAARFKDGALECREAVIDSAATDRQAKGTYTFCRKPKGEWGMKSPSKAATR